MSESQRSIHCPGTSDTPTTTGEASSAATPPQEGVAPDAPTPPAEDATLLSKPIHDQATVLLAYIL
jgi:hypothetical protein